MYYTGIYLQFKNDHMVRNLELHLYLGTIQKTLLRGGAFSIFISEIWAPPSLICKIWISTPSTFVKIPLYVFFFTYLNHFVFAN